MAGDDKLNRRIKDSFQSINKKAHSDLWGGISSALNEQELPNSEPGKDPLSKKVQEAFTAYKYITPEVVWYKINKQLNIDRVWDEVSDELDKEPVFELKRLYKMVAAIVMLLLTPITLMDEKFTGENPTGIFSSSIAPAMNEVNIANDSAPVEIAEVLSESNNNGNESLTNETFFNDTLINKPREAIHHNQQQITKEENKSVYNVAFTDPVYTPMAVLELPKRSISHVKETESTSVSNPQKRMAGNRFSLGPSFSYNNTWLINNETRKAQDKGSLISANKTFKENFGVVLFYQLSPNGFIASDLKFVSRTGQQYHMFRNGNYEELNLELNYSKSFFFYQHNFFTNNRSIFSDITVRLGGYGAMLLQKNGEIRSTESNYSNSDFGLYAALGQEKKIGNFILSYGINADKGITNIFKGNELIPARFNKTYNINVGTYFHLRYPF